MNSATEKTSDTRSAKRSHKRPRKPSDAERAASDQIKLSGLPLPERAYQQLEELITTLELPPGTLLGEQDLVQRLGIGRTPVREALQRLARDGLVVVMPRRGIMVSEINVRNHLRLLETRRVLERLVARLAAERATDKERKNFASIARHMRDAAATADGLAFMRWDNEFNKLLVTAARNEFAMRSLASMAGLSRRFWYEHYKLAADLPLAANLHAKLCDFIAQRDLSAAEAASDQIIDYIESFARKTLDI